MFASLDRGSHLVIERGPVAFHLKEPLPIFSKLFFGDPRPQLARNFFADDHDCSLSFKAEFKDADGYDRVAVETFLNHSLGDTIECSVADCRVSDGMREQL